VSLSRDDDLLGGMWAVAATVFLHRYSYQSVGAALSSMGATSLSFALSLALLLAQDMFKAPRPGLALSHHTELSCWSLVSQIGSNHIFIFHGDTHGH
jgi:hypothetical protein